MTWQLGTLLGTIGLATCIARGQSTEIVQLEPLVKEAAPLEAEAGGASHLTWPMDQAMPETGWQQLEQSTGNLHIAESGAGGYGSLFAIRGVANTPYFSD